jgi:hypothetical protein
MTALGIVHMHQTQGLREQLFEAQCDADRQNREETRQRALRASQRLRDLLGAEGYREWWNAAPEQGFLEAAEAKLAELLSTQRLLCGAKLYRGIFIWHDADGWFIIRADGQIVPFQNEGEARGFVDSALTLSAIGGQA